MLETERAKGELLQGVPSAKAKLAASDVGCKHVRYIIEEANRRWSRVSPARFNSYDEWGLLVERGKEPEHWDSVIRVVAPLHYLIATYSHCASDSILSRWVTMIDWERIRQANQAEWNRMNGKQPRLPAEERLERRRRRQEEQERLFQEALRRDEKARWFISRYGDLEKG